LFSELLSKNLDYTHLPTSFKRFRGADTPQLEVAMDLAAKCQPVRDQIHLREENPKLSRRIDGKRLIGSR
jgi:hypothetical protein